MGAVCTVDCIYISLTYFNIFSSTFNGNIGRVRGKEEPLQNNLGAIYIWFFSLLRVTDIYDVWFEVSSEGLPFLST